jgi:glyoxylase-like metal-dependent hydrolase (beta-lactamase superfamily II)
VLPVRSPTLPPATHTNAWVLGNRSVTVIDPASPWAEEQQRLAEALTGREVSRILLTHHHHDHISGAEDLRRRTGAPIVAHPLTADQIPFTVDERIDGGTQIETDAGAWQVLHTPGHAQGHLCLLRDDGYLVAGDMVAGVGTILLQPPEGNLSDYLASLQQLIDTGAHTLLPAHGPDITPAADYLRYYIAHRHKRTDQIRAALVARGQPSTPAELVPLIYADIPPAVWPIAARQVLCHLLWLADQGDIIADGERYMPA